MSTYGVGWWAWLSQEEEEIKRRRPLTWSFLKRVIDMAVPFYSRIGLLLSLMVASSIFSLLQPLLFSSMIDDLFGYSRAGETNQEDNVWRMHVLGMQSLLLAVVQSAVSLFKSRISTQISEGLILDLQCKVFGHFQKMSLHFYVKTKSGEITSRLYTDSWKAQTFISDICISFVSDSILLLFTFGLMIQTEWRLTVLAFLLAPLCYFPALTVGKRLRILTKQEMAENAEIHSIITENLGVDGALLVKIFGRQDLLFNRFKKHMEDCKVLSMEKAFQNELFYLLLASVTTLGTVGVKWAGGYMVLFGNITPGTLVAFTFYLTFLYAPMMSLSNIPVRMTQSLVGFERVFEVLDLDVDIKESENAITLNADEVKGLVEYRGVSFSYDELDKKKEGFIPEVKRFWDWKPKRGKEKDAEEKQREEEEKQKKDSRYALTDITFTIKPGQLVALVGASGSGKTTTSQLLPRLYDPLLGQILIDGYDLKSLKLKSVADVVGVVTQDTFLFYDTIRANIMYAKPDATEEELIEATRNANLHEFIASLPDGYDTVVGERGHRLSGGERQRVAIARVFLKNPRIMVLDEATSSLDSISEALIQEAFAKAMKSRSSLVIAHRLSTILQADVIVVLDQGKVVEIGTHDKLLRLGGKYQALYETQFKSALK